MQNFIVWMNPDREESAAAAAKLNGAVLTAHTDGAMAAIRRELKILGLGADLAIFAQTCEEFAKQANADMVCISSSNGDAVAAVTYLEDGYAGEGVSAVADMRYLMSAYRQYFNRPDKMVIFQVALQYLSDEDIAWIFLHYCIGLPSLLGSDDDISSLELWSKQNLRLIGLFSMVGCILFGVPLLNKKR